jgi:DNA-binding NarL/FixJ family response regulator
MSLTVLLVDHSPVMLAGLRKILAPHSDINVIGSVSTLLEALTANDELLPDVTVLDLSLADRSDQSLTQARILALKSKKMVSLTLFSDSGTDHIADLLGITSRIDKMQMWESLPNSIRNGGGPEDSPKKTESKRFGKNERQDLPSGA